jgi:vibriolysin
VVDADARGIPSFLAGDLGLVEDKSDPKEVDLGKSMEVIAPVFNASPEGLVLRKAQSDNIGDQHFRFRQVKNGRDVLGGEIVVHVRKGVIYAANGRARDDLDAPLSPVIDTSVAIEAALDASKAQYRHDDDTVDDIDIEASEVAPLVYKLGSDRMDLVYQVEVQGIRTDRTPFRDSVLVNAIDGTIVGRMPHIHTAKSRTLYNLNHGTVLPGTLARTEGQAANADAVVNDNYDRLGTTYDCYLALFNRDSYNGTGATMKSSVHYDNNFVNAYWDGNQMVYGDGDGVNASNLARSMDVTAHELTHAVTENESNLVYEGESGGLNESMSDIFGNTCEWYRDGKVVSANTWKVGEDVWTPATNGDALRYMNDPVLDGGSLDYWTISAGSVDVHYSSGIPNLAFYLLSQGGLHPRGKSTTNVTGIGIAKAAQIFYRANRDILTSISDFASAKAATEQAAVQLGYTAAEQASVTAAWNAVGVGIPAAPPVAISNGVPVTGIGTATNTQKFYSLTVPAGATGLSFTIGGGTGDADLYVRFGSSPTLTAYDCRPYVDGSAETCAISTAQAGTYYVMLNAYSTFSGLTLTGSYTGGTPGTGHLVINEVEYDEVGTDNGEFVEIYNGTSAPVNLSGYSLVLVNGGTSTTYLTQSLSAAGTLAAGQYLVVGNPSVTAAAGALKVNFVSGNDKIQNGAPDGVALVNGSTLVDALSYEGSITAASITDVGTVSLVEGTALASTVADSNTITRSLSRYPNGTDTENASTDWALRSTVTPGAAN